MQFVELLEVHGHSITDNGLMRLSRLPQLEDLRLTGLDIPPSGLANLQESQSIGVLWLIDTNVRGQHLRHVSDISSMHWLIVEDSDFNDEDLLHLRDAKQLRNLDLGQTKVTKAGVVELATYLPECSIAVGDGHFAPQSKTHFSFLPGEGLIRYTASAGVDEEAEELIWSLQDKEMQDFLDSPLDIPLDDDAESKDSDDSQ